MVDFFWNYEGMVLLVWMVLIPSGIAGAWLDRKVRYSHAFQTTVRGRKVWHRRWTPIPLTDRRGRPLSEVPTGGAKEAH